MIYLTYYPHCKDNGTKAQRELSNLPKNRELLIGGSGFDSCHPIPEQVWLSTTISCSWEQRSENSNNKPKMTMTVLKNEFLTIRYIIICYYQLTKIVKSIIFWTIFDIIVFLCVDGFLIHASNSKARSWFAYLPTSSRSWALQGQG